MSLLNELYKLRSVTRLFSMIVFSDVFFFNQKQAIPKSEHSIVQSRTRRNKLPILQQVGNVIGLNIVEWHNVRLSVYKS